MQIHLTNLIFFKIILLMKNVEGFLFMGPNYELLIMALNCLHSPESGFNLLCQSS